MTFFVDECMDAESFVAPLVAAGVKVERHRDHFARGTSDADWITTVAEKGWVIVTADRRTGSREAEVQAIITSRARVLHLAQRKAKHADLAANFVATREAIERHFDRFDPPCLASLTRPGRVGAAGEPGAVNRSKRVPGTPKQPVALERAMIAAKR